MCVAKTPHIDSSDPKGQKDPPILRNPILDGMLGNIAALRGGRNALRIDLLNPLAIPVGGGVGGGFGGGGGGGSGGSSGGGTSSGGTSRSGSSDGFRSSGPSRTAVFA
jgi:hypothetical protein